ncbi:hypothetical protein CBL_09044 [Carabus blaptoides fortunei]
MKIKLLQIPLCILYVHVLAFEDVNSELFSAEMIEDGKNQYQLIQERGNLPQYGDCWKNAVEHIHEGCRYLTEDVQSDIALQITNCFLVMSGHDAYHCDHDKKQNVRRICISSMSDRAFNVYTEFYTHAQNICWFLRGQIWQEKISERTFKVGEQLDSSLTRQELLLNQQQQSLTMQEQLLTYGRSLEKVLNDSRVQVQSVMEEIRASSVKHQQLLSVMTNSLAGLQSWLIGEISWFDSVVFYISGAMVIMFITSTVRTASARLPLLFILSTNTIVERILCDQMSFAPDQLQIQAVHEKLSKYVWLIRQGCVLISAVVLCVQVYLFCDYAASNNKLLIKIQQQNSAIRKDLEKLLDFLDKVSGTESLRRSVELEIKSTDSEISASDSGVVGGLVDVNYGYTSNRFIHGRSNVKSDRHKHHDTNGWTMNDNDETTVSFKRYNLRNRAATPISLTGK